MREWQQRGRENDEKTYPALQDDSNWTQGATKLWSARTLVMCAFIAFLTTCIVVLFLLRKLDDKDVGFAVATTTSPYTWKYGSTAIFVLVIALWRQLDTRIRAQAAWKQMTQQPTPAALSLSLDYVSPILPVAFFKAIRNRHWGIVLAISVFAFLKLAVVASTGLFNPELSILQSHNMTIQLAQGGVRADIENGLSNVADRMAVTYIGSRWRNLTWPDSTLPYAAFQDLSKTGNNFPKNSTITAGVQAFYPSLDCEVAETTSIFYVRPSITEPDETVNTYVDYSTGNYSGRITLYRPACTPEGKSCDALRLVPFFTVLKTTIGNNSYVYVPTNTIVVGLLSMSTVAKPGQQAFSRGDPRHENQTSLQGNGWSQSVDWASVVVCRSHYSIEEGLLSAQVNAQGDLGSKSLSGALTHSGKLLPDYATYNLSADVSKIVNNAGQYVRGVQQNPALYSEDNAVYASWFAMMLSEVSSSDIVVFKDAHTMIDPANKVFQGLASTWVGSWLSFPDQLKAEAEYTLQTTRLRLSLMPFWMMVTTLGAALLCVIALLIMRLRAQAQVVSDSVFSDGRVLKGSTVLHSTLKTCGYMTEIELERQLAAYSFKTEPHSLHGYRILLSRTTGFRDNAAGNSQNAELSTWWSPLSTKTWFACLTLLTTLLTIIGLEIVQKASDSNMPGLWVKGSGTLAQDLISILPAMVVLIIAMLFGPAEFSLASTAIYRHMMAQSKPISHFLTDPLQQLSPVAIYAQVRLRHFTTSIIMFAALLGTTMTIITSGLYTLDSLPQSRLTNVTTLDEFNFDKDIGNATAGSNSFTFLQRSNASFPAGTHDEFAYPLFNLDLTDPVASKIFASVESTTLQIEMPVVRASLDCFLVPQSELTLRANMTGGDPFINLNYPEWANVTSVSELPRGCTNTFPAYNNTNLFRVDTAMQGSSVFKGETSTIAKLCTPKGVYPSQPWLSAVTWNNYLTRYPPGCPSVAFTLGTYTLNATDTSTTTRLVCSQYFEEIPSTLTFTVPGLQLDPSRPPILHEDQAHIVSNMSWNFTHIFHYGAGSTGQQPQQDPITLDSFFQAVVTGVNGIPITELLGPQNHDKLINAIQHVYRLFMAQVIGNDMRSSTSMSSTIATRQSTTQSNITKTGTSLAATIQDPTQIRIVQNRTSKLILQIILSIMTICLIIVWRDLSISGKTLPHNPCTIAGRMSYLAGSRFVETLDTSASDKQLSRWSQDHDIRLRMGWWQDGHVLLNNGKGDAYQTKNGEVVSNEEDEGSLEAALAMGDNATRRFGIDIDDVGTR